MPDKIKVKKELTLKEIKEFLKKKEEDKKNQKVKKTAKNLSELKPMKPIEGGGFAPIGKPVALKKNYANAYKKNQ